MNDKNEVRLSMATINPAEDTSIEDSDTEKLIEFNTRRQQIIPNEKQQHFPELSKRNFGKHRPFLFIGKDPLFTIGPDCINFLKYLILKIYIREIFSMYVVHLINCGNSS